MRWLIAVALAFATHAAHALCLQPLCTATVSTTPVGFGAVQPFGAHADAIGSVRVGFGGVAGLLIPYRVDIGSGNGGTGFANRRMNQGSATLAYQLYADSGRTTVWGDGSAGTVYVQGSLLLDVLGLSAPNTHWIYGRVPSGQMQAVPGPYADTVTVTVTYY